MVGHKLGEFAATRIFKGHSGDRKAAAAAAAGAPGAPAAGPGAPPAKGGGEGKSGQGNPHPVTPWGQKTKGYKTRRNKRTQVMIVRDRRQK
jgi:hypothetical protein